jgi:hypothetical protein
MAAGVPGRMAQHCEKVAGGKVQCGGAPIWWKKWIRGKGPARRRGCDLLEVGEMGQPNWGKVAPLADRASPQSSEV